jgi:hypothetical protein
MGFGSLRGNGVQTIEAYPKRTPLTGVPAIGDSKVETVSFWDQKPAFR